MEIASFILMIGLLIVSANLWRSVFLNQQRKMPHLLSPRESEIVPLGFSDVLAAILIQFVGQVAAVAIIYSATGASEIDLDDALHLIIMGAMQFVAACVTILFLWYRYSDARAAGIHQETLSQDLKLGFAGFFLFVPPMLILQSVLTNFWEYEHPTLDLISPDSSFLSVISAWWMATIVAPFTEEVLFRSVLLGWLLRCFANPNDFIGGLLGGKPTFEAPSLPVGDTGAAVAVDDKIDPWHSPNTTSGQMEFQHRKTWPPVFIGALFFAVVHIGQGPAPIPIFFLGLGLCFMYRQTGGITDVFTKLITG